MWSKVAHSCYSINCVSRYFIEFRILGIPSIVIYHERNKWMLIVNVFVCKLAAWKKIVWHRGSHSSIIPPSVVYQPSFPTFPKIFYLLTGLILSEEPKCWDHWSCHFWPQLPHNLDLVVDSIVYRFSARYWSSELVWIFHRSMDDIHR